MTRSAAGARSRGCGATRGFAGRARRRLLIGGDQLAQLRRGEMRGDLAAYAGGARVSVHLLANTSGLSEHLPKALAAFLREHPDISLDVEERESVDIAAAIAREAAK